MLKLRSIHPVDRCSSDNNKTGSGNSSSMSSSSSSSRTRCNTSRGSRKLRGTTKCVRFDPDVLTYEEERDWQVTKSLWYHRRDLRRFRTEAFRLGRDRFVCDTHSNDEYTYSGIIERVWEECCLEAAGTAGRAAHPLASVEISILLSRLERLVEADPELHGLHKYCVKRIFEHKHSCLAEASGVITDELYTPGRTQPDMNHLAKRIERITRSSCRFGRYMAGNQDLAAISRTKYPMPRYQKHPYTSPLYQQLQLITIREDLSCCLPESKCTMDLDNILFKRFERPQLNGAVEYR